MLMIWRLLKYSFILMCTVVAVSYLLLTTSFGIRASFYLLNLILPIAISVEKVHGSLMSTFSLQDMVFKVSNQRLFVHDLNFSWSPEAILHKKFLIKNIAIDGVKIDLNESNKKQGEVLLPTKLFSWLSILTVNDIKIKAISIEKNHMNIAEIESINFSLDKDNGYHLNLHSKTSSLIGEFKYQQDVLEIKRAEIQAADIIFKATGKVDQSWHVGFVFSVPSLKLISGIAEGRINCSGKILGIRNAPEMIASIDAQHIEIDKLKIAALTGSLLAEIGKSNAILRVQGKELSFANYYLPTLQLQADMTWVNQMVLTNLNIFLDEHSKIKGNLMLPPWLNLNDSQQPITGNLHLQMDNINALVKELSEVKKVGGALQADLTVAGKLGTPNISVSAKIDNGSLFIPRLGVHLSDIILKAHYSLWKPLTFTAQFNSGDGNGFIQGSFDRDIFSVALSGSHLHLLDLSEYKAIVSPNLQLKYEKEDYQLSGKVFVDSAQIEPKDFSSVTALPNETVFVNQAEASKESSAIHHLALNLSVILGKDIKLLYKNLDTLVNGQLQIKQTFGNPAVATGELYTTNGKFFAYGRHLKVTMGKLIYTGNILSNPGLDIRAETKLKKSAATNNPMPFSDDLSKEIYEGTESLTVGILIKGTASKPLIHFFSEPAALREDDVLSYIVFGYPRSQIKELSALGALSTMMVSAAKGEGILGIDKVTNAFKKTLGLTNISISNTEFFDPSTNFSKNTTTFNIGKKFGHRFVIDYKVGIFDSLQILTMKYKINKHLSIKSETNNLETGADIVYEIERD